MAAAAGTVALKMLGLVVLLRIIGRRGQVVSELSE
jgi:hypothetical protein